MLDTVPLARAGWVVGDGNGQSGFIGEGLKLALPQAHARSIAATAVGGDQETGRAKIAVLPQGVPPAADALDGEGGGIVIDTYIHPTPIVSDVVNAVGRDLAEFGYLEVVDAHRLGFAFGPKLTPTVLEVTDQLLLLRIDRDGGLPGSLELLDLLVDVLELGITIRMRSTFQGLSVGLETEAELAQQPANQFLTGGETALSQRAGEVPLTSAHPQQGR